MQLNAGCELQFDAKETTPLILMLRPRSGDGQWIMKEEYDITPAVTVTEFTDMYGNLCQRVIAPEGPFSINFSATVQTADDIDVAPGAPYTPIEELPDELLHYTLPSRWSVQILKQHTHGLSSTRAADNKEGSWALSSFQHSGQTSRACRITAIPLTRCGARRI